MPHTVKKNNVQSLLRWTAAFCVLVLVAYNSVYFKKLDEVKSGNAGFSAVKYAATFWTQKLPSATSSALDIDTLLKLIKTDREKAFESYSHALGIGNVKYFLVKGKGKVEAVETDQILIRVGDENLEMIIATEYIFGNAVRDAAGIIDINAFENSMDFNTVSAEINQIIRKQVVTPFREKVKTGDVIEFVGAIELNREHPALENIEVIPVRLEISKKL